MNEQHFAARRRMEDDMSSLRSELAVVKSLVSWHEHYHEHMTVVFPRPQEQQLVIQVGGERTER